MSDMRDHPPAWVDEILRGVPPLVPADEALTLLAAALEWRRRIVLYPQCDLAAVLVAVAGPEDDAANVHDHAQVLSERNVRLAEVNAAHEALARAHHAYNEAMSRALGMVP